MNAVLYGDTSSTFPVNKQTQYKFLVDCSSMYPSRGKDSVGAEKSIQFTSPPHSL